MTVSPGGLRKGQVVRYRRFPRKGSRIEYMRLLEDASERVKDTGAYVVLYGYRTRADGQPTHVRPVTRVLFASEVDIAAPEWHAIEQARAAEPGRYWAPLRGSGPCPGCGVQPRQEHTATCGGQNDS
jgi:hypothetical protein